MKCIEKKMYGFVSFFLFYIMNLTEMRYFNRIAMERKFQEKFSTFTETSLIFIKYYMRCVYNEKSI